MWANRRIDFFLLGAVGVVIALLFLAQKPWDTATGGTVVITVAGEEYGRFPLDEDAEIPIKNQADSVTNTLTIENGAAKMTAADCPDKLCLHQKKIDASNETIVCLPNKIVVSVENKEAAELDAVVR